MFLYKCEIAVTLLILVLMEETFVHVMHPMTNLFIGTRIDFLYNMILNVAIIK